MHKLIIRRFLEAIPVLFIVATATFFLVRLAPGGPFDREKAVPPEVERALNAHYGLDEPIVTQYFRFIGNLLRGDLGPRSNSPDGP